MYDVIIIGGGPIGLACGIEARKNNLNYLIIEKGTLANSIYNYPKNMTFFSTSDRLEIGDVPFISHGVKPTRTEALEYYTRVAGSWDMNIHLYESVHEVHKKDSLYEVLTSKTSYHTTSVIVASGFYDIPYMMNVPGEDLPKVKHYYDEPYPYFKQKIIVVGAANSAVDVALETYRKGAEVTMVIREPEISKSVKYWVRPDLENRINEGVIKAHFNSSIINITEKDVTIKTPNDELTIENDFVLAMTGYKINYKMLEQMGIKINSDEYKTPIYDLETNETNMENIYLAGVICGGLRTNKWFIENSRVHAKTIISSILKKSK